MSDEDAELRRLHVVYLTAGGDRRQAFAIDGRDYTDVAELRRDVEDAWDELTRRQIPAEFETRSTEGQSRMTWLPTWQQYKPTLDGDGG